MKIRKCVITVMLLCLCFAFMSEAAGETGGMTSSAYEPAGGYWIRSGGSWEWQYCSADGQILKNALRIINGKVYYFDDRGIMASNVKLNVLGAEYDFTFNGDAREHITPSYCEISDSEKSEIAKQMDRYADGVLAQIITPEMNSYDKARAICVWIRQSIKYVKVEEDPDFYQEAYNALKRKNGACFSYFSLAQLMLSRAGIECKPIIRSTDHNHYWHMVKMDDGRWFHYDTSPRAWGAESVLATDRYMLEMSNLHNRVFEFDLAAYPRTIDWIDGEKEKK